MANNLDTDSLELMIREMGQYIEMLHANRNKIAAAATACDTVLGGDALSQKYVSRIEEVVMHLDQTAVIAREIQVSLQEELRRAMMLYES